LSPIYDTDGDLVTAAAALDSEVSIDGGTFADCTNEATEIATSSCMYSLVLTAAEMNGDRIATITKTTTSDAKTAVNVLYTSTRQIDDLCFPTTSGRSIDVEATGEVGINLDNVVGTLDAAEIGTGAITAAKFAAGAIDATAIATGAIDADAIAADAITAAKIAANAIGATEIADAAIDAATFATGAINAAAIATDAITAAKIAADAVGASEIADGAIDAGAIATGAIDADALAADAVTEIRSLASGTADSGTTTTLVDAALTEADTDYWKNAWLLITSGTEANQVRLITGFTPGTDTITFAPALTQAVATNTYEILPAGAVDLRLWAGSAPNALVSGAVDADVSAMQAGVVTAAAVATGAIDADAIAADAIGASEIADGAIDAATFATGAITAAAVATDAIGAVELAADAATEIADAILKRDIDQVEATMALHSLGTAILKAVSRIVDDAGVLKLYRTNASTLHMSQTITTDAAADPIDELTVGV